MGDDASPRTLARCMTARAATRAQQLIVQHEAAKPDPVAVAKQDEEQSCASIEEVFERFCGLYRLEHMTNTIFAKFCRDTKGVISKKTFPVPMIDMVWTKGAGKAKHVGFKKIPQVAAPHCGPEGPGRRQVRRCRRQARPHQDEEDRRNESRARGAEEALEGCGCS